MICLPVCVVGLAVVGVGGGRVGLGGKVTSFGLVVAPSNINKTTVKRPR